MFLFEVWCSEVLKHVYGSELQKLVSSDNNWSWYGIHNSMQVSRRFYSQQGKVNSKQESKWDRIIGKGREKGEIVIINQASDWSTQNREELGPKAVLILYHYHTSEPVSYLWAAVHCQKQDMMTYCVPRIAFLHSKLGKRRLCTICYLVRGTKSNLSNQSANLKKKCLQL